MSNESPQARGGYARANSLTPGQRREIAQKAAVARWDSDLPAATHEGEFKLGEVAIACAVLPNGTRIITQATFLRALGRSRSPKAGTGVLSSGDGLPFFLQAESLKPYISEDLVMSTAPIFFRTASGGKGVGYDARILPKVAEVYLRFRDAQLSAKGGLAARYEKIVAAADLLIRGLAHVGVIALVDEATGFQRDRAKDALERILEQFIAKELRPWVHTFPNEFYEQLFRLRGLQYPRDSVRRPRYFGHLTNNIIYDRLAPKVRDELVRNTPRKPDGRLKHHLHRRLTEDVGHPKLREHLASVTTIMKLSSSYPDFMSKLDHVHQRYGETYRLPLDEPDSGVGL
jgi:P63C domain-containing protein